MKSFAVAAILASTAVALPTTVTVGNNGVSASGMPKCLPKQIAAILPNGVPTCMPKGKHGLAACADKQIASQLPNGFPTCLPLGENGNPLCLPHQIAAQLPNGIPTCLPKGGKKGGDAIASGDHQVTGTVEGSVHSVFTVTNKANKNVLVELEPVFAQKLTGLALPSVSNPIGEIQQIAPTVSQLSTSGLGAGFLTVATQNGQVALIKLSSTVEGLFATLGLPQVGTLVGSAVGTLEGALAGGNPLSTVTGAVGGNPLNTVTGAVGSNPLSTVEGAVSGSPLKTVTGAVGSNPLSTVEGAVSGTPLSSITGVVAPFTSITSAISGSPLNNVMAITNLNGDNVLAQVEPSLTGLLSNLNLGALGSLSSLGGLSALQAPVGTVLASVPAGSDLVAKAQSVASNPSNVMAILAHGGASVLLVEVQGVATGLLSTLGLSAVGGVAGGIVPVNSLPLGSLPVAGALPL